MSTRQEIDFDVEIVRHALNLGNFRLPVLEALDRLASLALGEQSEAQPVDADIVRLAVEWYDTGTGKDEAANRLALAVLRHKRAPANVPAPSEGAREVTDEMVAAYLAANDAYWKAADELPRSPDKWRSGTPSEATRVSLQAALATSPLPQVREQAAQPPAEPSPMQAERDSVARWSLWWSHKRKTFTTARQAAWAAWNEAARAAPPETPTAQPGVSKAQAERIVAALDPSDGGYDEVAAFVRGLATGSAPA